PQKTPQGANSFGICFILFPLFTLDIWHFA
ncbi:unnamed protein product, partial [marine sediment metagenome]